MTDAAALPRRAISAVHTMPNRAARASVAMECRLAPEGIRQNGTDPCRPARILLIARPYSRGVGDPAAGARHDKIEALLGGFHRPILRAVGVRPLPVR